LQQAALSRIEPLRLRAWTVTCAAGAGRSALHEALRAGRSALTPSHLGDAAGPTWIGKVDGLDQLTLPPHLARWDCRNNRLAWFALNQDGFLRAALDAVKQWGPTRVAVLIGTSTSSIGASEDAYRRLTEEGEFPPDLRRPEVHTLHSLGGFVAAATGAAGPGFTVATACASSAKVFAQAERLLRCGLVDAAVVGGVDSLCGSVLHGFHALGLVSAQACKPFDAARAGVSLAEAGGFALLERRPAHSAEDDATELLGYGESCDAHHMSAPHPQGLGARIAMQHALARAGLRAGQIDYLNLHGTATPKNDEVEAAAVADLFGAPTRVSSTKGVTGHTLGASGIVEAAVACISLSEGLLPGSVNCSEPGHFDPRFTALLQRAAQAQPVRVAMSNSFGFGGNNCSLVFARSDAAGR
jgi:3-oxoacyl-[acyl-carrier-protein] synthase I